MTKINNLEKYQEFVNPANGASFDDGHLGGCNIYGDPAHELPKLQNYQLFPMKLYVMIILLEHLFQIKDMICVGLLNLWSMFETNINIISYRHLQTVIIW